MMQAEARKLAFYLFYNIKGDTTRNHMVEEDLHAFLNPDVAAEAFQMLDLDGNSKVTLHVGTTYQYLHSNTFLQYTRQHHS